jgi:hypothetical protein
VTGGSGGWHPARVVSISAGAAGSSGPAGDCPQHHLGLDLGEVAPGHRLVADGWCLHGDYLTLFYFFTGAPPAPHESADLFLNAWYDADVSPPDANYHGADGLSPDSGLLGGSIEYSRPPAEATVAWLDIFDVDFDVDIHVSRHWVPDEDYLRSRISRLTFDLAGRTGSAEIFAGGGGGPGD